MELHLSKLARVSASNNAAAAPMGHHKPQILQRGSLGSLIPPKEASQSTAQQRPLNEVHSSAAAVAVPRHNGEMLAKEMLAREMLARDSQAVRDSQAESFSVVVSVPSNENQPLPVDVQSAGEGAMSRTWPRSHLVAAVASAGLSSVPPLNLKGSAQINADSMGVAGGKLSILTMLY